MTEVEIGTIVDGRYRVRSRIGSGGMADVYCAEDLQLGRNVALKLLHRRFAADGEFVERFRREASSAAGLQHPNVVGVYDRGEWDGTSYIAMEYLEGRSLKQLIEAEAPLDPVRAIDIAIQILKAARFAHKRGIVHRDLKPHNVIVDAEDRVKVTDFGIARAGASDMTQTGSIMGTAQYLSPEQAQSLAVSGSSDLYSVGVVLYEMLTGRLPFDGDSAVAIALKHVTESPESLSAYNPAITVELESVVLQALRKDPAERFADADEFIAALEHAREQILAGVASGQQTAVFAAPPVLAQTQRAPRLAPVPLGGNGMLPPGLIVDPDAPLDPPGAPPRRRSPWPWVVLLVLLLIAAGAAAYVISQAANRVVPNVVGRDAQTAATVLENAGFHPQINDFNNRAVPAGEVFRQDPAGGSRASKGSTITLSVSQGPGTATVPDVTGLPENDARKALESAGFKVRVVQQPSTTVPAGQPINTSPPANISAPVGSLVVLYMSSGPQKVPVPDVTGLPKDQAIATLQAAGFKVITTTQASSQPAGTVLSQSPAGNQQAPSGSGVQIVVAKALPQVTVPDLTGATQSQAAAALSAVGLKASFTSHSVADPTQSGKVINQRPAAGQTVDKGSTVVVDIGNFNGNPPGTPAAPPG